MSLENASFGRWKLVCDDPYRRGCCEEYGPAFGEERTVRLAQEDGWYVSEETGQHSCPTCTGLHNRVLRKKVENRSMTREECYESGDPFTAAFLAMAFGGDPSTAMLTTMFTGSTPLGVIASIIAEHNPDPQATESPFTPGETDFGGGGAGGSWAEPTTSEPQNLIENENLPVIVDPQAEEHGGSRSEQTDSSQSEFDSSESENITTSNDSQGTAY